jgi:hypothetical protein
MSLLAPVCRLCKHVTTSWNFPIIRFWPLG